MISQRSPSTVSRRAGSTTSINASFAGSSRKLSKIFGHRRRRTTTSRRVSDPIETRQPAPTTSRGRRASLHRDGAAHPERLVSRRAPTWAALHQPATSKPGHTDAHTMATSCGRVCSTVSRVIAAVSKSTSPAPRSKNGAGRWLLAGRRSQSTLVLLPASRDAATKGRATTNL